MSKIRVTFTLDEQLNKKLERLMIKLDRSKSWLISRAIKFLKEEG